jgi:hypothetical protein
MEFPLVKVFWLVTSDVDGQQAAAAATRARDVVARAADSVRESCGRVPPAMRSLRERVHSATSAPLDARGLRALENAFAGWVKTTGAGANHLEGATAGLRGCERLSAEIRPGYALWWDYSTDGKRWWVEMQVDNRTARSPLLDLSGAISVTGLVDPRPDRYMERADKPGSRRLFWGGSSADFMAARPFSTTSQRVGLGRTVYVYTTIGGTVYSVRPEVFAHHGDWSCSLPVPRLN